ncbi:hypothetical protein SteCoe_20195 [Stentor coeruleus]|uniref:Uncharacterized protein n=1 Tax=Stentor coeruleus TaxID=5963 RepID=A0A1R2BSD7_9CILI|nr:hypothetical protein SteCoe_20195 [Stentor coeruleus]
MHRHLKTEISDLYISGISSPIRSQADRVYSTDFHKHRGITSTPDAKYSSSNKWYIRGHKFVTIYRKRTNPKPSPILFVSGTIHRRTPTPNGKSRLLTSKERVDKKFNRHIESKNKSIFIPCSKSGEGQKFSSKNLQVDFQELSSWPYK